MLDTSGREQAAVRLGGPSACAPLPDAVIATRQGFYSLWREGDDRRLDDPHWLIRTNPEGTLRGSDTVLVRFDSLITAGRHLDHPALSRDRRTKTELCIDALSTSSRAGHLSAVTLASRLRQFDTLLRWRHRHQIPFFSALSPSDVHRFCRDLVAGKKAAGRDGSEPDIRCRSAAQPGGRDPSRRETQALAKPEPKPCARRTFETSIEAVASPPSSRTIADHLAVWSWLRRASLAGVLTADCLRFDPFSVGSVAALAGAFGKAGCRMPTLTPEQFLRVLGAGREWIAREGPAVILVLGDSSLSLPPTTDELDSRTLGLAVRVRHVMAACAAVIGGFAARRGGEVGALKAGCISHRADGAWMSIYIEKTDRAIRRVPVPESVVRAVETLEAMSAGFRLRTGKPWIFNAFLPGRDALVSFRSDTDMPAFARACGLHSGPHALTSPLQSHQLRRGYSVAFLYAFRLGNLPALQEMLRHIDEGSTAIYVTEATAGAMLRMSDVLQAGFRIVLQALPRSRQDELAAELERLEMLAASGEPLDHARCEDAALLLLQAWRRDRPAPEADRTCDNRLLERRLLESISIGSQLATKPQSPGSLLERAREHVRRVLAQ